LPDCENCKKHTRRVIRRLFNEIDEINGTLYGNGKLGYNARLHYLENKAREVDKLNLTVYGDGEDHVWVCVKVNRLFDHMVSRRTWIGYIIAIICSGAGAGVAAWVVAKMT
jgi:hypothetical protein